MGVRLSFREENVFYLLFDIADRESRIVIRTAVILAELCVYRNDKAPLHFRNSFFRCQTDWCPAIGQNRGATRATAGQTVSAGPCTGKNKKIIDKGNANL